MLDYVGERAHDTGGSLLAQKLPPVIRFGMGGPQPVALPIDIFRNIIRRVSYYHPYCSAQIPLHHLARLLRFRFHDISYGEGPEEKNSRLSGRSYWTRLLLPGIANLPYGMQLLATDQRRDKLAEAPELQR